ncbi:MAG: hypothetical protein M3O15_06160, partial [Acidobacteriota bacterium]|nr:hypothetical protein [Acidobacteriota bacterium]
MFRSESRRGSRAAGALLALALAALVPSAALAAVVTARAALPASPAPPGLEATIREASFIFHGSIEELGASNLSLLPASGETAIVRVEEVIDQPSTMDRAGGLLVTVVLADPASVRTRGRSVFFTNAWMLGEHVAVREVGHIAYPADRAAAAALRRQVAAVRDT